MARTHNPLGAVHRLIPSATHQAPAGERVTASTGSSPDYARADHSHPSLVAPVLVTLDAQGQADAMFGRAFASKPGITAVEVEASPSSEFLGVRATGWLTDVQGRYIGVTVQGMRARPLPVLQPVAGLLATVTTGVNAVVSALTGFRVFGGPAAGAKVSVVAISPPSA